MHYNYPTLIHAFELYDRKWNNLYRLSGNNYDKCDLVWRQVIGYLQRGLPAVDRFAFAQGLYDLVENKKPLVRQTNYQYGEDVFPDMASSVSSFSVLGFDFGIYGRVRCEAWDGDVRAARGCTVVFAKGLLFYAKLMSSKNFKLAELMQPQPKQNQPRV